MAALDNVFSGEILSGPEVWHQEIDETLLSQPLKEEVGSRDRNKLWAI